MDQFKPGRMWRRGTARGRCIVPHGIGLIRRHVRLIDGVIAERARIPQYCRDTSRRRKTGHARTHNRK